MSVSCGAECVVVLGRARWAWKRCTYIGSDDTETWPTATPEEFEPIPRICRIILAVYEPDLRRPKYAPSGGYRLNPDWVIKRVTYEQTLGHAPPYLIYLDWCISLNLAVKYADIIYSVVLQDDFLPRTPTPSEDIFKSIFCLPCLLFLVFLRDTFISEDRKLKDPRRLYTPGRISHIVERKFCRCGRYPPEVRAAIPVDGRFEHIVLSCNATSDHAIIWIEREAEKALQRLKEMNEETVTTPPKVQKQERKQTIEKEHKDALERAVSLNIPHAVGSTEEEEEECSRKIEEARRIFGGYR
ncbi:hypothetical protein ACP275_08G231900 [Erythranthe tilingii]